MKDCLITRFGQLEELRVNHHHLYLLPAYRPNGIDCGKLRLLTLLSGFYYYWEGRGKKSESLGILLSSSSSSSREYMCLLADNSSVPTWAPPNTQGFLPISFKMVASL